LSEETEIDLLSWILREGVDQGWFIRPAVNDLLLASEEALDRVLAAAANRFCQPEAVGPDPFPDSVYEPREIPGGAPGYIVVTQRCDLVRPLRREPIVELARVRLIPAATQQNVIDAAKKNSARWIYLADGDAGAWIADLAHPALLPKDTLREVGPGVHPVGELRARRRLALRLGQRRTRTPVPTEFVESVQRPLIRLLLKNATNRALSEHFSEFLGVRMGAQVRLIPVVAETTSRTDAEDAYRTIEKQMAPEFHAALHETSGPLTLEDLDFWLYLQAFKFDFDEVTFSARSSDTHPLPHE